MGSPLVNSTILGLVMIALMPGIWAGLYPIRYPAIHQQLTLIADPFVQWAREDRSDPFEERMEIRIRIEEFTVSPVLDEEGRIRYAEVRGAVSVEREVEDVVIRLEVDRPDGGVDELVMARLSRLPAGVSNYMVKYAPIGGWKAGNYSFQLFLLLRGRIRSVSRRAVLSISPSMVGGTFTITNLLLAVLSLIALFTVLMGIRPDGRSEMIHETHLGFSPGSSRRCLWGSKILMVFRPGNQDDR